jgi:ABC-2 type transport system ATP-binding protein
MNTRAAPTRAAQGQAVIQTAGLTKRFGDRVAIAPLDFQIPGGCAFGLLGPNGAGKTTLIRMVLGLIPATSGEITLLGHQMPVSRAAALAGVGAIVEEPRFHPYLTGRENLRVAAAVRNRGATGRIDAVLGRVGLSDRADDKVGSYSLGMRQRLGIGRCLLSDPRLLILDEPMNGLDPAGILEMRGMIRSLVDEGRSVVLSSHLLDEVEKTCDALAIIDRGELIAAGTMSEIASGTNDVLVGSDDPARAAAVLLGRAAVTNAVTDSPGVLRVTPADAVPVSDLNRWLVEDGVRVNRLEPVRATLEDRFLEITSRLGEAR